MKLEYLLALTKEGITIYSSCFGTFCANIGYDKTLMSGFLSALSTMPEVLGHSDDNLQSLEMGYTKLLFNHTHPSGHIICAGIVKDTIEEPKTSEITANLFRKMEDLLENQYKGKEWAMIRADEYKKLEETMVHAIIEPTLVAFNDNDVCDHDGCSFDHHPDDPFFDAHRHEPMWELFPKKYERDSQKIPLWKKIFAPVIIPIARFFDKRLYRKKLKKVEMKKQ